MIISHRHGFIFFAVPKTGTHAVRQALRAHLGEDDLEQVGLFERKKFPFPELKDVRHGHVSAREIRPVLGEKIFASYFKFAFVRNPYDRFVSYCAFKGREGAFPSDPRGFMRYVVQGARPPYQTLLLPQSEFLIGDDGKPAMDFIGRTEDMQASYDRICARIGLAHSPLERVNASPRGRAQDYLDRDLRQWVNAFYRRDFEMFGYQVDTHATEPA
jgi:Sulfotransferase family